MQYCIIFILAFILKYSIGKIRFTKIMQWLYLYVIECILNLNMFNVLRNEC